MILSRLDRYILGILLFMQAGFAFASERNFSVAGSNPENAALNELTTEATSDLNSTRTTNGMIMLDYQVINLPEDESIDLMGVQYFHQMNNYLYLGMGIHAPLFHGNYGGFMVFNATLHAQKMIHGNLFVNGGISLGGGGGGSSVQQSRILSGEGGFIKTYVGMGYDFGSFSAGINYSKVKFTKGIIDDGQINLFFQKPVYLSLGPYSAAGKESNPKQALPKTGDNTFTFELNNIHQLNPTGKNKDTIHTFSLQYSHFLKNNYYAFISAEVGYDGMPLYNQVTGGFGKKFSILPRVNFYSQIAFGSGGFAPEEIDTGSGFLVYPKLSLEYMLSDNIGLALSTGYLTAPKGTSRNITWGAAINYRLTSNKNDTFSGYRFSIFQQSEVKVRIGGIKHGNINYLAMRLDKLINENWYIPIQGGVAYNDYREFPGHGELLVGIGIQNAYKKNKKLQGFFQIAAGPDSRGIILKPAIGLNYSISDNIAIYGHLGKTMSLHDIGLYSEDERFSSYSVGLGLTYRFSLL